MSSSSRQHPVPPQPGVDVLPDQVARLHVEGDADDDAERPQPDRQPVEARVRAPGPAQLAVGVDVLQARDRGRQDLVAAARAVGPGGGRARDRDVRQRPQVVQRPAALLQPARERAVGGARADRDRPRGLVEDRLGGDAGDRDQRVPVVGEVVEGVPGAERADPAGRGDRPADLVDRPRGDHRRGGEPVGTRPVSELRRHAARHYRAAPLPVQRGAVGRATVRSGEKRFHLERTRAPPAPTPSPRAGRTVRSAPLARVRPICRSGRSELGP